MPSSPPRPPLSTTQLLASRPTIPIVKARQAAADLGHVHVAFMDLEGFVLAHTDEERAEGTNTEDCGVHEWLAEHDPEHPPVEHPGWYVITDHWPDQYSEPYPVALYDLTPLELIEEGLLVCPPDIPEDDADV